MVKMKTVINETQGFKTILEVRDVLRPAGYKQIRFSTEWEHARRDGSEQVQYTLVLSPAQIKNLKDLL
jgi:hypothetical protein